MTVINHVSVAVGIVTIGAVAAAAAAAAIVSRPDFVHSKCWCGCCIMLHNK